MSNSQPIFIVGSSRSGTTLLAAMLNAHPRIACGPESQILNKIKPRKLKRILADRSWPTLATAALAEIVLAEERIIDAFGLTDAEVETSLRRQRPGVAALFESIVGRYASKQEKSRWAEKTPRHLLHLDTLREAFPEACIIRMVRDPRDSALSMRQLPWASDTYLANLYLWCDWYEQSDAFFDRDHRCLTVIYEQLIAEPRQELQRICQFIGEPFVEAMLDTETSGRAVATQREVWKKQVSGPLDPGRLFRWKRELNDSERLISGAVCEKWLKRFGYELDDRSPSTLYAHGLDRRRIESNLGWLYQRANQGWVYLPALTNDVSEQVYFIGDEEIGHWRSWSTTLTSLLARRLHKKKSYIQYGGDNSRHPWRRQLLHALAEPA